MFRMRLAPLLLLLIPHGSLAQHLTHREWLIQSFRDMRLVPAFGERPKNAEQQASDSAFVAQMLATNPDRHACAGHLLGLGFDLLRQGNMVHAMYRFNHAYLMEPENPGIRSGYGAFFVALDRPEEAAVEYQKGLALDSANVPLLLDLATVELGMYHDHVATEPDKASHALGSAKEHVERAVALEPNNALARYKLAVCQMLRGDCSEAWTSYRRCMAQDPEVVQDSFVGTLRRSCPTPP